MTSQAARTLGFLFADLRGYSAFVEAHGDDAGAQLLRAYRDLVREQVARFDGAEIRTEGDSFYIVFPSASSAVRCGLAILEAAGASTAAAGRPIAVGIGVHAGETTETDEGYVGSAVNIAARVCSVARPGELLVTETVQSLIRTRLPLRFVSRGVHRLKGIRGAIDLFRVDAAAGSTAATEPSTIPHWVRRHPALLGVTVAGAVVLVIGVAVVSALVTPQPPAGQPPGTPGSRGLSTQAGPAAPSSSAGGAFPTAAETPLVAAIDPRVRGTCRRADPDDVLRYPASQPGTTVFRPISVHAGIECTAQGPTTVWYWHVSGMIEVQISEAFFAIQSRSRLPEGSCAEQPQAHGRWQFGSLGGRILCRHDEDAHLVWTYDDYPVIARARRPDGDHQALYEWWLEHGRTLSGEFSG